MMSLWDALRMNMMISYQELVRTFPNKVGDYEIYCKLCPKFMLLNLLYVTNFDIG